jgi:hypothetical protein
MLLRLFLALLLSALATSVAQAQMQGFPPDKTFQQIAANRDGYERVVFLFGDSVVMMCSLEEVDFSKLKQNANDPKYMVSAMAERMRTLSDPGDKAKDPLWPMHSPASAMNTLFAASGLLATPDGGATIPSAKLVATYAGALGLPFPEDAAGQIRELTKSI